MEKKETVITKFGSPAWGSNLIWCPIRCLGPRSMHQLVLCKLNINEVLYPCIELGSIILYSSTESPLQKHQLSMDKKNLTIHFHEGTQPQYCAKQHAGLASIIQAEWHISDFDPARSALSSVRHSDAGLDILAMGLMKLLPAWPDVSSRSQIGPLASFLLKPFYA